MEEIIGVAYVKASGEITRIELYNGFSAQEGAVEGDLTVHYIEDASGINFSDFLNSHIWNNGWVDVGMRPNGNFYWSGTAWEMDSAEFMALVRNQRDMRLYQSDWTQVADAPVDSAAWATYRQALRDFPSTVTTESTLEELIWPTSP